MMQTPNCSSCGTKTEPKRLDQYDLSDSLGLSARAKNVPAAVCPACGTVMLEGAIIDAASRAAALSIVRESHWAADELKFIRKFLRLTQGGLAELLEVDRVTITRWEGGSSISGAAVQALRAMVVLRVQEQDPTNAALSDARSAVFQTANRAPIDTSGRVVDVGAGEYGAAQVKGVAADIQSAMGIGRIVGVTGGAGFVSAVAAWGSFITPTAYSGGARERGNEIHVPPRSPHEERPAHKADKTGAVELR